MCHIMTATDDKFCNIFPNSDNVYFMRIVILIKYYALFVIFEELLLEFIGGALLINLVLHDKVW